MVRRAGQTSASGLSVPRLPWQASQDAGTGSDLNLKRGLRLCTAGQFPVVLLTLLARGPRLELYGLLDSAKEKTHISLFPPLTTASTQPRLERSPA